MLDPCSPSIARSPRSASSSSLLFAILVVFQTLSLPGTVRAHGGEEPGHAYLRWPLTAVAVFWVLCVQVVIVSHLEAAHAW